MGEEVKKMPKILHLRSNAEDNNGPALPSVDSLAEGEIAINYHAGMETIAFKNDDSGLTVFKSDEYYIQKHNEITSNIEAVESRVESLETEFFMGTREQYQEARNNNQIATGALVILLDE
jgi:hypothetical protein